VSEGDITIPESACCWGCGYSLRGLGENRCPECGRGFEPGEPRSYRLPGRAPAWVAWMAKAPGRVLISVYAVWAASALIASSETTNSGMLAIAVGVSAFLIGLTWVLHAVFALVSHRAYRLCSTEFRRDWHRWFAFPMIVGAVIAIAYARIPLDARFLISLPWFDDLADRATSENAATLGGRWVGLFYVYDISVEENGVYFNVFSGSIGTARFSRQKAKPFSSDVHTVWRDWYFYQDLLSPLEGD